MTLLRHYWHILSITISLFIITTSTHAQITLDGTMGQSGELSGPDYTINDGMGTTVGTNLFHSFGIFNINSNESATFMGPGFLENVISRVTGGNLSIIDGLLKSEITGADFYFINPAGVMFGQNATLDVTGSFHTSTADYIKLADDGRFDATEPGNSILTSAAPSAFGFLDNSPAGITVDGGFLEVSEGETLSAIGGDIEIKNGYLYAPGGQINVVSVASKGEVGFEGNVPVVDGFESLGNIDITHSSSSRVTIDGFPIGNLDAFDTGGGTIYIRGGGFVMDGGLISADTLGNEDGGVIDIRTTNDLVIKNNSLIAADTIGSGRSGNIFIKGNNLTLDSSGQISTTARTDSSGKAGDITITANSINMSGNLTIGSDIFSNVISSSTFGIGDAGSIQLNVGSLTLTDGGAIFSGVGAGSSGKGGNITITSTGTVNISNNAFISGTTSGTGNAGSIQLNVGNLNLTNSGLISEMAVPGSTGKGGSIGINTTFLNMSGDSRISARSAGTGNAGDITIVIGDLLNSENSSIATKAENAAGGNINIYGNDVQLLSNSEITASVASGEGGGGNVTLDVDTLVALDDSDITARADEGFGGNITINAKAVFFSDDIDLDASSNVEGREGAVQINSPVVDISGDLVVLPKRFLDVEELLPSSCETRTGEEEESSFTISGRDSLPAKPDEPLPSL